MSGIVTTSIYLDGLRERESVAGVVAGALRDLEARADRNSERVIWSSISLETETDLVDDRALAEWSSIQYKSRTLTVSARTIDPSEVSGA